jgi:hypothetical protein
MARFEAVVKKQVVYVEIAFEPRVINQLCKAAFSPYFFSICNLGKAINSPPPPHTVHPPGAGE